MTIIMLFILFILAPLPFVFGYLGFVALGTFGGLFGVFLGLLASTE